MNRSHKRHPGTNASNADMFWDFQVNNQESIHALMFLFGDRGLPSSVRHTNGYSGNTYKFTKSNGLCHYVRIHFISNQGTQHLSNPDAARLAGYDPDNHVLDLQSSIESGNFPSWTVYFQAIHPSEIAYAPVPIFDMTKVWPHKLYPLRRAGRMALNRNPSNWFAEIEQAAFSPSNMVPGIEPSPDPMLQARMFAYPDAARYRLGVNYQFLPTNAPKVPVYCPIERDGFMNFTKNYGTDPNYIGAQLKPVKFLDVMGQGQEHHPREVDREISTTRVTAPTTLDIASYKTPQPIAVSTTVTDRDFEQATALWRHVMQKQEGAQARFVENASAHAAGVKDVGLRGQIYGKYDIATSITHVCFAQDDPDKHTFSCTCTDVFIAMFGKVDTALGEMIKRMTETKIEGSHLHPHKTAWH
jgi:catalase